MAERVEHRPARFAEDIGSAQSSFVPVSSSALVQPVRLALALLDLRLGDQPQNMFSLKLSSEIADSKQRQVNERRRAEQADPPRPALGDGDHPSTTAPVVAPSWRASAVTRIANAAKRMITAEHRRRLGGPNWFERAPRRRGQQPLIRVRGALAPPAACPPDAQHRGVPFRSAVASCIRRMVIATTTQSAEAHPAPVRRTRELGRRHRQTKRRAVRASSLLRGRLRISRPGFPAHRDRLRRLRAGAKPAAAPATTRVSVAPIAHQSHRRPERPRSETLHE